MRALHASLAAPALALAFAFASARAVHAQSADAPPQCRLEGTYRADAGFFTRFDGRGNWGTFNREPGPRDDPATGGRYFVHGTTLSFVAETARCNENTAIYTMTFQRDCQRVEIRLTQDGCRMTNGPVSYVFERVVPSVTR